MTARCLEHNIALTNTGRCNAHIADHLGGLHTIPDPTCPRCTTPTPTTDHQSRAAGEREDET